jgi:hypothetical protein
MAKKTIKTSEEIKEEVVSTTDISEAKRKLLEIIEIYKTRNPKKYEDKKDELEAKLKSL